MAEITREQVMAQDWKDQVAFVLGDARSRAFVWEMLSRCGVFGASFTGEPLTTAFNEGKRHVGLNLMETLLTSNSNAFTLMRDEHILRQERYLVIPEAQKEPEDE